MTKAIIKLILIMATLISIIFLWYLLFTTKDVIKAIQYSTILIAILLSSRN